MHTQLIPRKLFISYSRLDEASARKLYGRLRNAGLDVWLDIESLLPGQEWEEEIKKGIRNSHFVLLLLSKHAVGKRGYYQKEIRLALETYAEMPSGDIYILPVRLDDCEVPSGISKIQHVDLFEDWDKGIDRLLSAIAYQQRRSAPDVTSPKAAMGEENGPARTVARYLIARKYALDEWAVSERIRSVAQILQVDEAEAVDFLLEARIRSR